MSGIGVSISFGRVEAPATTWTERRVSGDAKLLDGFPTPKQFQVMHCTPKSHRVTTNGHLWLRRVRRDPKLAEFRVDKRASILALAEFFAVAQAFELGCVKRPGMAQLIAGTGLSERTIYRHTAWLRDRRHLGHVQHGSTPATRGEGDLWDKGVGNLAAEFVLLIVKSGRPKRTLKKTLKRVLSPIAHARANHRERAASRPPWRPDGRERRPGGRRELRPDEGEQKLAPVSSLPVPRSRTEMLGAVRSLRAGRSVLQKLSERNLRSVLRPWFLAGWAPRDVARALDYLPTDAQHRHEDTVRHPAEWIRSRLGLWPVDEPWTLARIRRADRDRDVAAAGRKLAAEQRQVDVAHPGVVAAAQFELQAHLQRKALRRRGL